jgi:hypothetical protein
MEVWKTLLDDGDGDYDFSAVVAGDALGRRRSVPHVHYDETTPSVLIVLSARPFTCHPHLLSRNARLIASASRDRWGAPHYRRFRHGLQFQFQLRTSGSCRSRGLSTAATIRAPLAPPLAYSRNGLLS